MILISVSSQEREAFTTYEDFLFAIPDSIEAIELSGPKRRSGLLIVPEYQGRVVMGTLDGPASKHIGWANLENIFEGTNGGNIGGLDRLWIGPLGGQYSFYYQQIEPQNNDNWLVPAEMNEIPYEVMESSPSHVSMRADMQLTNFIGTTLSFRVNRDIRLIDRSETNQHLGIPLPESMKSLGFESRHKLTNRDSVKWNKEAGLAGLWSLNMLQGTKKSVVIIPLKKEATLDEVDQYFGPLEGRIEIQDRALIMQADGNYWSKIGVAKKFAKSVFGSYSPEDQLLTIVQFNINEADSLYFNSKIGKQKNPYRGEIIQAYNHGNLNLSPMESPAFYELESISSMKELTAGESISHWQRVFFLKGKKKKLNAIAKEVLGVNLENL